MMAAPVAIDEFEIIRRYFTRPSGDDDVLLGVGDDAAVLRTAGSIAVTVDTLVEGVHFPIGTAPDALGHRALAVNLSDIAAMGARPRWCTLALTLHEADPAWLEGFARGFFALAERFDVALVGGNLARGPLTITVEVIGAFDGRAPLTRAGGRSGDDVYVTGTLGDATAGLAILTGAVEAGMTIPTGGANGSASGNTEGSGSGNAGGSSSGGAEGSASGGAAQAAARRALVERFLRPTPRVEAGLALAGVATAAIDVSDGLAADLAHVCAASGCGAVVDVEALPRSAELDAVAAADEALGYALSGGDDYELCFTAAPADAARIEAALAACGTPAQRIGRLTDGAEIVFKRHGERIELPRAGYMHF